MASQRWDWSKLLEAKGLILALLSAIVALVAVSYKYLEEQTNLDVMVAKHSMGGTVITVENVSIKKAAEHHVLAVFCLGGKECMPKLAERPMAAIGAVKAFLPAIQRFNHPCDPDDSSLSFALSLPAGGKVEVWVAPEPAEVDYRLSGKAAAPPCDQLRNVDTNLLVQSSAVHYVKASVLRTIRISWDLFLPALIALAATGAVALLFIARLFRRKRHVVRKR